jgi:hypothetical protein
MRSLLLAILLAAALPAAAHAAFAPPLSIPSVDGSPVALAIAGTRGVVVTQAGGPPYDKGTQAVIGIAGGTRQTFADTFVLDHGRGPGTSVDLLVRRGSDLTKRGDLVLRRVHADGRINDLWSIRTAATDATLARGSKRTHVVWPAGSVLRIVTRPDGGIPTKPRTARVALRDGYVSLDLAVDRRARLVAAVGSSAGGTLVASLTPRGTVLARQVFRRASGLVQVAVTSGGRAGVLVEDTGIEGEGGECVRDQEGRHIRAIVREAAATRFAAVQTIESPPFGCGSSGALLRATGPHALSAIYQGGSYDLPPLLVRAAVSQRGKRFGSPITIATDARADSAVVTSAGELVMALLRKTTQPEVYAGALSVLRPAAPEEPVAAAASAPLLGLDDAGRAVLAWRAGETLQVALAG